MPLPRLTVITPSYNQGKFLERTICSVLDQGYPNLEYMVIDGDSWDESPRIIKHYSRALAWSAIEPDSGAAEAINKGLKRSRGQIVMVVNADDLLLPGALQDAAKKMGDGGAAWLSAHALRIDEDDQMLGDLRAAAPTSTASFVMHDSGLLPTSSTFYRREVFQKHGLFDAELPRAYGFEYACRLLVDGMRPTILPETLAARREHAHNRGAVEAVEQGVEMIEASQRYAEHLPLAQRYALWSNCDERLRIFTLARAEKSTLNARRLLLQQAMKHPWWLRDERYRRTLLYGVSGKSQSQQPRDQRRAA